LKVFPGSNDRGEMQEKTELNKEEERIAVLIEKCPDIGVIRQNHAPTFTRLLPISAKCEDVELTKKLFDEIHERNSVAWSTMISG
ncbi:pentatricopeptide repeat-containing protein, partial [Corchorus capsularis]